MQLKKAKSEAEFTMNYDRKTMEEFKTLLGEEIYQKSLKDIMEEIDPENQIDPASIQMKLIRG